MNKRKFGHMRTVAVTAVGAVAIVALAGCGNSSGSASGAASEGGGKKLKVGSLVYDTTVPYFTPMIAGEKKAAEEMGVDLDIQNGQGDLSKQIAVVQQFIAQKKDVLVIAASDSKGIAPAVKLANQAGIPVIANQTVIDGAESVTYVGSDNVTYGRYLGKGVCQLTGGKGNIAVIMGILGSSPQFDRKQGLTEELAKSCPDVKILAEATANWDNTKALAVGQDFLNRFPQGKLDLIVDQGPEGVAPAQWAKKNGRTEVKWIVGDVPKAVAASIEAGNVDMAVHQDPADQGYKSVINAVNWARGDKDKVKTPRDYSENRLITKENLNTVAPY